MSDLGIFSLLVVGRDTPHPFGRMTDAIPRSTGRFTPIGHPVKALDPADTEETAAAEARRKLS